MMSILIGTAEIYIRDKLIYLLNSYSRVCHTSQILKVFYLRFYESVIGVFAVYIVHYLHLLCYLNINSLPQLLTVFIFLVSGLSMFNPSNYSFFIDF